MADGGAQGITRRALLKGGAGALGLAGLGLLGPLLRLTAAPQPASGAAAGQRLDLGLAREVAGRLPADSKWHAEPNSHYWLRRDEGGLQALLGTCTHLGCTLKGEGDGFACPCHGSRFDVAGQPTQGPARSALAYLSLSQDSSGHIWLQPDRTVTATFRLSL